jgi:hypothetical protein
MSTHSTENAPVLRKAAIVAFALAVNAPIVQAQQSRAIQAGTYDLSLAYGGGIVEATMEIGYKGDSITVSIKLGDHASPVKPGARTGNKLILESNNPSNDVRYELEFTGDAVAGKFRFQGETSTLTGKRRNQGS